MTIIPERYKILNYQPCSICFERFSCNLTTNPIVDIVHKVDDGDRTKKIYRDHLFHLNCINEWIRIQQDVNKTCPLCRDVFIQTTNVCLDNLIVKEMTSADPVKNGYGKYHMALAVFYGQAVNVNLPRAVQLFQEASDLGCADAQFMLFVSYLTGKGVKKNSKQAVEWLKKSAAEGCANAQYRLGLFHQTGKMVEKDTLKAVEYLTKSADQNHANAHYKLWLLYKNGTDGIEKNFPEAIRHLTNAAEQGHVNAQYDLANCYQKGQWVEKNLAEAIRHLTNAAEQGHRSAQYKLGMSFQNAKNRLEAHSPQRLVASQEAAKWMAKAAEQGHPIGQYRLGLYYQTGDGVIKNDETAIEWLKKAANKGCLNAQYDLGIDYVKKGGQLNISEDLRKKNNQFAFYWIQRAADEGMQEAQLLLGAWYKEGWREIVELDCFKAFMWYDKAGKQGDAEVQFNEARSCYRMPASYINRKKAFDLFLSAASKGHPMAHCYLGDFYMGKGGVSVVPHNYQIAARYYLFAGLKGVPQAEYFLGTLYEHGHGFVQNHFKAFKWYQKSFDHRIAAASYKLGQFYETGRGIEKNLSKAIEFYTTAAQWDCEGAQTDLNRLKAELENKERGEKRKEYPYSSDDAPPPSPKEPKIDDQN